MNRSFIVRLQFISGGASQHSADWSQGAEITCKFMQLFFEIVFTDFVKIA
jgi:hypothetical protein